MGDKITIEENPEPLLILRFQEESSLYAAPHIVIEVTMRSMFEGCRAQHKGIRLAVNSGDRRQ